jgi:uncharacterized protein
VPVFIADVKGDVAGLAVPGTPSERISSGSSRSASTDWSPAGSPVVFWDLSGRAGPPGPHDGHRDGPTLLARILELNDTQEGVLDIVFRVADEARPAAARPEGPARAAQPRRERSAGGQRPVRPRQHGSIGAIQRALLRLERRAASGSSASRRWSWPT